MSKTFKIATGKWDVPTIGKVDSTKEISDDKLYSIYKLRRPVFPWITLGPEAESYLKKQKLVAEDVAKLILNAQTQEEAERLATLSDTKTVERVLDTKLKSFEN